ncbi:MAG TPA: response regulator [Opitutales bacterium]|jgi:two-component system NtrC family response regulator|nr:response regulator [Opitutales bacterium]
MGHRILILDDDVDFNSLLTDIFSQAGYDITPELDPQKALALIREFQFDLVVTDQRMPGISGKDFLRELKKVQPRTPIIMVSGFLDNETIRELIREGVGGVFLKPLNVFSLLKRTAKLLEHLESGGPRPGSGESEQEAVGQPEFHHTLPFSFSSFPCRDTKSAEFAQKLYALRNFKSYLTLTGPRGTNFAAVCRDFEALRDKPDERFLYLTNTMVESNNLLRLLHEQEERERVTLCFLEADTLDLDRQRLLPQIARRSGAFAGLKLPTRFIFCLSESLDALYDRGLMDENLYLLTSSSELAVPGLEDARDDIPLLAQQILVREAATRQLGAVPKLDVSAKAYLRDRAWSGNYNELQQVVLGALGQSRKSTLTRESLEKANMPGTTAVTDLRQHLARLRDEYTQAAVFLCNGSHATAAEVLGVSEAAVDTLLAHKSAAR